MSKKIKPLRFGDIEVEIRIIQGGMGIGFTTGQLPPAVSNCDCLGVIAGVGLGLFKPPEDKRSFEEASIDILQDEITFSKNNTNKPIGVNLMVAMKNYYRYVEAAIQAGADIIISGAGLPMRLPEYAKYTKIIPIVSSARAFSRISERWKKDYNRYADGVIVEGPFAGGHLGFKEDALQLLGNNLDDLTIEVIKVAKYYSKMARRIIPVIAAGGVFNGKDIAHFIGLGAQGVQIASRFVVTSECPVSEIIKNLYISAKNTLIFPSPLKMPGRVIRTPFLDEVEKGIKIPFKCKYKCLRICNPRKVLYCIAEALLEAFKGNLEKAVVFAGYNVSRINKKTTVPELVNELVEKTKYELEKM